jgi:hypothetical protein
MDNIFDEIETERHKQDAEWGGPEHDDTHSTFEFRLQIDRQAGFIQNNPKSVADDRQRLIKIAALAVAGIESIDRKNQF